MRSALLVLLASCQTSANIPADAAAYAPADAMVEPSYCGYGAREVDGVCRCAATATGAVCPTGFCSSHGPCLETFPGPLLAATDSTLLSAGSRPVMHCIPGSGSGLEVDCITVSQPTIVAYDLELGTDAPLRDGGNVVVDGTRYVIELTGPMGSGGPTGILTCEVPACSDPEPVMPLASPSTLLTAFDGTVFFQSLGQVRSCPARGGCSSPVTLATDVSATASVADETGLYVVDFDQDGSVLMLTPGNQPVPLLTGMSGNVELAISDLLYVATSTTISTCPKTPSACTPTPVTTGTSIRAVQVDREYLYWIDNSQLRRCPVGNCTSPQTVERCYPPLFVTTDFLYCGSPAGTVQIAK